MEVKSDMEIEMLMKIIASLLGILCYGLGIIYYIKKISKR
jgi:hypothetical protein